MTHKFLLKFASLALFILLAIPGKAGNGYITAHNHQFFLNGKPYYFIGTNYWHGAILASAGSYGDRARLLRELDFMKKIGITNLRIQAGAEGPDDEPFRVTPTLQVAP